MSNKLHYRMSMNDVVSAIDAEIARMEQVRKLLSDSTSGKRGRKPGSNQPAKAKRTMSAAARRKIADAQRKRWAAQRKLGSKPD
jgi:hypothetical protein